MQASLSDLRTCLVEKSRGNSAQHYTGATITPVVLRRHVGAHYPAILLGSLLEAFNATSGKDTREYARSMASARQPRGRSLENLYDTAPLSMSDLGRLLHTAISAPPGPIV